MIRTVLFAGAAALCFAPMAQAEHQNGYGYNSYQNQVNSACEREKDDNKLVGGLIGAVAGGALGVAIADGNDHHSRRGYRGHRGHRGHGRRHGYRRHRGGGNGDEIAGAVIGGLLGAVIGSEIAGSSTNCNRTVTRYNYADVPSPTRQPYGPAWNSAPQSTNPSLPVAEYPRSNDLSGGPVTAPPVAQPPQPPIRVTPTGTETEAGTGTTLQCQVLQRETRTQDGSVVRDPVRICQMPDGTWQIDADEALY